MEPGSFPKLKLAPSFKRTISGDGSDSGSLPRYTSLKDIMNSSPKDGNNEPGNAFDSVHIPIRNELVKHAASAYVMSATVNPANRDQDWMNPGGLWERIKGSCVGFDSCWQIHFRVRLQALCRPVIRLFYQVVHRIRNGIGQKVEVS